MKVGKYFSSLIFCLILGGFLNLIFVNCGKFNSASVGNFEAASSSSFVQANPNDIPGNTGGSTGGSTTGNPSGLTTNFAGTVDPNCLNSTSYDTCVIFKNPVASKGSAFPSIVKRGDNLDSVQTLGVALVNRIDPRFLRSNSIRVTATSGTAPQFSTDGKLKVRYSEDRNRSWLAQIMAYFWITTQEQQMILRTGNFFAKNKDIPVDAFVYAPTDPILDASTKGNAYFSSQENKVVLGYAVTSPQDPSIAHEMALSAEVYLHEMGHANLYYAVRSTSSAISISNDTNAKFHLKYTDNSVQLQTLAEITSYMSSHPTVNVAQIYGSYCLNEYGCIGGINEGAADFHHLMLFSQSTPLGETIANSMAGGLNTFNTPRDVTVTTSWLARQFFDSSAKQFTQNGTTMTVGGEIHGMGSAYASILWAIYNHPQVNKQHFEKIFSEHLKLLTNTFRFQEARGALLSAAQMLAPQLGNHDYSPQISQVFASKGIP